jgi:phosphatidylserine/phosphatidylglycerophosphate/cardiolipin synthase-like enzyme
MVMAGFLRAGAANFSASGLEHEDNDLIVIEDAQAAAKFKHAFEARFASGCEKTDRTASGATSARPMASRDTARD